MIEYTRNIKAQSGISVTCGRSRRSLLACCWWSRHGKWSIHHRIGRRSQVLTRWNDHHTSFDRHIISVIIATSSSAVLS